MLYQGNIRDYLSKQPLLFDGARELTLQINIYNLVGNPAKNGIFAIRSVLNRYTKSILMPEQWRSKQTHLRPMQEIILRQKRLERL